MKQKPGTISADYKVVGGKLLRVRLQVEHNIIQSIRITGDFFMHPEPAIEQLERQLIGIQCNAQALSAILQQFFERDIEIVGASAEDFVTVIMKAYGQ
jgi:lipoate-protein ligase A